MEDDLNLEKKNKRKEAEETDRRTISRKQQNLRSNTELINWKKQNETSAGSGDKYGDIAFCWG